MPESEQHLRLKRAACQWLWESGYAAIAEEVVVPGVGIIDVVGAGKWRRRSPRRASFDREPTVDRHHIVFVECKAMRADFLRDQGRQGQFVFALDERVQRRRAQRRLKPRHASGALGKFDTCLARPHGNLHYLLTPPRLISVRELPRRWGWLVYDGASLRVTRRAAWQEVADTAGIEGAIARSLTAQYIPDRRHRGVESTYPSRGLQPARILPSRRLQPARMSPSRGLKPARVSLGRVAAATPEGSSSFADEPPIAPSDSVAIEPFDRVEPDSPAHVTTGSIP